MAKRPSFQFYPADWPGTKWIEYDLTCAAALFSLPHVPGCYVIYLDSQLMYVGQSSDICKRIASYRFRVGYGDSLLTPWGPFNSGHIKVHYSIKYGDWAMRELRLIRKLKPQLNCVGSTKKRKVVSHG